MKKSTIIILVCLAIVLGMIFGIIFGILDDKKIEQAQINEIIKVNELIEKIEVHQSEKIDDKTVQRLTIHYNCIGAIEIPDLDKLPENNVSVHTRQGVDVHYAACAS